MATDIVITAQSVFRLSTASSLGEIQLSPEMWRVIAQIDGARTIGEIVSNLREDPAVVERAVAELYRLGLLRERSESDEPVRTTVNGVFFDQIEAEFIKMIGPFGPFLIEDEISSLGATRESFPRDKVAELVERLSAHIAEEPRRIRFQQTMLEAIRKV